MHNYVKILLVMLVLRCPDREGLSNLIHIVCSLVGFVTHHIFCQTTTTIALDRGMSIVDVSRLLGHTRVETTMEYITTNSDSVKNNHKNYVI